jgi:hypothetical protein
MIRCHVSLLPGGSLRQHPGLAKTRVPCSINNPEVGGILLHFGVISPQYPADNHPVISNFLLNKRKFSGTVIALSTLSLPIFSCYSSFWWWGPRKEQTSGS